jgi:SAM-dependent MidA family methyltransferase
LLIYFVNIFIVHRGSTGKKPKENIVQEQLVPDICELEKKIQRYQKIQLDAETYSLQDAVEWDAEMKRFDASATRVKNQLMDTFTTIDLLRKNTARLRSQNLLSSRLFNNPASYYSVASSVEMYVKLASFFSE